ncbi:MAG TPA: hypothetical protein VD772_07990, partial [Anseongella sp.]|nr:hypothetical protein [Anseongella sp.]
GIAERSPRASLTVSERDAFSLGLEEGQLMRFHYNGRDYELPVQVQKYLPEGMGAVPLGLKGVPFMDLPGWIKIER